MEKPTPISPGSYKGQMRKTGEGTQLRVCPWSYDVEWCKGNESLGLLCTHPGPFTHSKYRLFLPNEFWSTGRLDLAQGNH